jgi:hypothetical protein
LQEAGADLALVECIPAELAARLTEALTIPLIGIGAGPSCDAQVLVCYDMLGITPGRRPKFSKKFPDRLRQLANSGGSLCARRQERRISRPRTLPRLITRRTHHADRPPHCRIARSSRRLETGRASGWLWFPPWATCTGAISCLVERARKLAPRTVASIFVNPTQFGPNEDFAGYPRTLD